MALQFPGKSAPQAPATTPKSAAPAAAPAARPALGRPAAPAARPAPAPAPAAAAPAAPPARTAGSIFKGVEAVRASMNSNYIKDGHFYVFFRNIKSAVNANHIPFVAVEMTICTIFEDVVTVMRKGEECSHLIMANNQSFLPNVKAMVAAVMGVSPDEVTEQNCIEIAPDDKSGVNSPLAGMLVEVEARTILTRGKQQPFTKVSYKRAITATELAESADENDAELFARIFGGPDVLQSMIEAEQAQQA